MTQIETLTNILEKLNKSQGTSLRDATCPWHGTTGRYCINHGQARGI